MHYKEYGQDGSRALGRMQPHDWSCPLWIFTQAMHGYSCQHLDIQTDNLNPSPCSISMCQILKMCHAWQQHQETLVCNAWHNSHVTMPHCLWFIHSSFRFCMECDYHIKLTWILVELGDFFHPGIWVLKLGVNKYHRKHVDYLSNILLCHKLVTHCTL